MRRVEGGNMKGPYRKLIAASAIVGLIAVAGLTAAIGFASCASAAPRTTAPSPMPEYKAASPAQSSAKLFAPAAPPSPAGGAAAQSFADASEGAAVNDEEYDVFPENSFKKSSEDALSTFAVDVDTASYSVARRYLNSGSLPPTDAIRIEELVNYFDYGWAAPTGGAPIAVSTEVASCPWALDHRLLAVGLRTRSLAAENLPSANLVFLIDSSGSMSSPDKLPLAVRAFSLLVETLRPQDRVSIVVYAGSAGLVLPSTSGANKAAILAALDGLQSGGSTAGGEGITLAYETALQNFRSGGNNRVILATDGDFNVGPWSEADLTNLITTYRDKGVFLSVLGFGQGNVKDSKMEALADKGNGNYGYIDGIAEARRLLVTEMGATLLTVAKDVKIQVEFDPTVVGEWRLIGYENRLLAAEDFSDDTKDAGEMGAGHRVTALYELVPARETTPAETAIGIARTRYKRPNADASELLETKVIDEGRSIDQASTDLRFASAVAAYGMLLRKSEYSGKADWEMVLALAQDSREADSSGRRAEFYALAEKAAKLSR
jgi:Ca-activated chloride channel family protein